MALCVQDPPNRNADAPLIPATVASGVHTTEALALGECWCVPLHMWPCTCVGTHQPRRALAWADLAIPGEQQDVAPGGCPCSGLDFAVIQYRVFGVAFSRHEGLWLP